MFTMTRSADVTQTVILAAGNGSRLTTPQGVPKPLTHVAGVPLLAHALAHARASGCVEAVIVVGHEKLRVKEAAEAMASGLRLCFVETPDHAAPNGESLLAAEPMVRDVFFLQMVDHLFGDVVLPRLTTRPLSTDEAGRVLVDRAPVGISLDDATKVRLAADRVTAIGKALQTWDAIDAGCFLLCGDVFDALRRAPRAEPRTVSSGMRQLVLRGALGWAETGPAQWVDVDTPDDLLAAERIAALQLPSAAAAASS
jgi:choline kinase